MSTPYVAYSYADGSANTLRPTKVTYPNGREVDYAYGAADSPDDLLSRVFEIKQDSSVLARYDYLGATNIVRCDYAEPQVRWDLSPTGNTFTGLDSLNRVVDNLWRNYGASTDADRIQYTYDRAGNRLSRENAAAPGGNDELYNYDGVNRLVDLARGDLTVAKDRITEPTLTERWNLDATGNWSRYSNADFLAPADTVDQTRTSNQVNELTELTSTVGASWAQPAYDRAGNMTALPQPLVPTANYEATYDAWNRLVLLEAVAAYAYDPLNRRVTVDDGTNVRHAYFSQQWQTLEERLDGSTDAERQFVWGLRYVDDLILRDRTTSGPLDERLYALQDANWNVDAIVDADGGVQERYRYAAYGAPTFLQPDFTPRSPNESEFNWESLYCGYKYDEQTGLYCVRWRYLQPGIGGWIGRDFRAYVDGFSLSAYARLNPIHLFDPSGLACCCCCVESIQFISEPTFFRDGLSVGHSFKVGITVSLSGKQNPPAEPCRISWREKSTQPDLHRPIKMPAGEWHDMADINYYDMLKTGVLGAGAFRGGDEEVTLEHWIDVFHPYDYSRRSCDATQSLTIPFFDAPQSSSGLQDPDRELEIQVQAYSGLGCNCPQTETSTLFVRQYLWFSQPGPDSNRFYTISGISPV